MKKFERVVVAFFILASILFAQQKQKISVEWIYSKEPSKIFRLPEHVWLQNNKAVIYDSRKPADERTFELFDPETAEVKPMLDMKKAVGSLKTFLANDIPDILGMPESFDENGEQAVYVFNGDIFLLNLKSAEFNRITNTKEEEKDVNFSPDGSKLAYVRLSNLYVYDITSKTEKTLTTDGNKTILNGTLSGVEGE